ncbi:YeeE/YedE family protein [Bombardia bombarda]|uniref:YeeE/YedE family protein n=1 Tax=Bombardia bombarda TaxID=252184 RepID=A0AA40C9X5_9PEZI|nr:YeeE/YedE family protein [Bombardia bombarda]
MDTLISGAAFGAALTASGVFQPSVIISQLKFQSFHMIQAFLTAAASSACIVTAAHKLGYVHLSPRSFSSLGLFGRGDGNIIGGLLLGAGMMLSGACPGTVLAQVGLGVRSGFYALQGAVLAGIFWTGVFQPFLARSCPAKAAAPGETLTVYENLGVKRSTFLLGFEALCAAVVAATLAYTTMGPEAKIHPILGGLCIGAAQLTSLLLRKSLMGTSTSYEEIGNWFWGFFKGNVPQKSTNILFCSGMVGGAWLLGSFYPALAKVTAVSVSPLSAGLGGFLMILGSRIAGGCTSGHGISGISLMSTSSFLTIAAAFGAVSELVGHHMGAEGVSFASATSFAFCFGRFP